MIEPELIAQDAFEPDLIKAWQPISVDECLERFDFDKHTRERREGTEMRWYTFCQIVNHLYEYPTQELVAGLVGRLATTAEQVKLQTGETFRLLEVAAGQGRLTVAVSQELHKIGIEHHTLAVDNQDLYDGWSGVAGIAKKMDAESATKSFLPHAVLGAWLPFRDWTPTFRALSTVRQYIFLGNPEQCGTPAIWGDQPEVSSPDVVYIPEYAADGFEKEEWSELQPIQLCWSSMSGTESTMHPSKTVAFNRTT